MKLLLRLMSYRETKGGFVLWQRAPDAVTIRDDGVVTIACLDKTGNGPTIIAELRGDTEAHGKCVEIFVQGDRRLSLLDLAVRSHAEIFGEGSNLDQLQSVEAAWDALRPLMPQAGAIDRVAWEIGQAFGKHLAACGVPEQRFKALRGDSCQWRNGPLDFDMLCDAWKDAVGDGYDGR